MPPQPPLPPTLRWTWRDHAKGARAELAARAWLGPLLGLPDADVPLQRDPHGRPRLTGAATADCDTGWSHSGDGLVIVFGRGLVVGVDLEQMRPRPNALALARRFFAGAEAEWLEAVPEPARELAFLRLWCAKEAVLKAHGRGLAFGLSRLSFEDRGGALVLAACDADLGDAADWRLHEWSPRPGYRAAMAWRECRVPTMA